MNMKSSVFQVEVLPSKLTLYREGMEELLQRLAFVGLNWK